MSISEVQPKYDAVVLLCGGVEKDEQGGWGLNFESRLKALAATFVFEDDLTDTIISSGGAMWGAPPLGQLMSECLSNPNGRFYVPADHIIPENDSTDSGSQIENIMRIVADNNFQRVGVIADSVHLRVIIPLFHNYGLDVQGLPMEDILINRNQNYQRIVDKLHRSWYWKWWSFKYSRLEKNMQIDPRLESPMMRNVARFQRTKLPWLRIPGTGGWIDKTCLYKKLIRSL